MKILALDLGTKTGFATNAFGPLEAGTWKLALPKEVTAWGRERLTRRRDPRVPRLANKLAAFRGVVDCVVFEDVQFASYTAQVQLWASLRAAVWLFCNSTTLIETVPVGTLKKFATGNGAADKDAMGHRFLKHPRFSELGALDDNGIDACWLFLWAEQNLSRAKL